MMRGGSSVPGANHLQLLFVLRNANMQSTADQAFTKIFSGTQYAIAHIYGVRKTGAASVACAGGIYTGAAKAGDALVAAGQNWVSLAANVMVTATLAAVAGTAIETATPNLSLTTGSTAACTADIFVFGIVTD